MIAEDGIDGFEDVVCKRVASLSLRVQGSISPQDDSRKEEAQS